LLKNFRLVLEFGKVLKKPKRRQKGKQTRLREENENVDQR